MKLYTTYPNQSPIAQTYFELPAGLKSRINLLILVHVLAYLCYVVLEWKNMLEQPLAGETINDYIRHFLAISSRSEDLQYRWSLSVFTYQFIHFHAGELLLSVSMLWLFGHILQARIGQAKVIVVYFLFITMSAVVFNLSHVVFPVFSKPNGIMEGAFGGVLGIMTAAVCLYGRHVSLSANDYTLRCGRYMQRPYCLAWCWYTRITWRTSLCMQAAFMPVAGMRCV